MYKILKYMKRYKIKGGLTCTLIYLLVLKIIKHCKIYNAQYKNIFGIKHF